MTANPHADVDQMLAAGRTMLARFDHCYQQQGTELPTEDLFGSLLAFLITYENHWTLDDLRIMVAAAVIDRHRKPVQIEWPHGV
jgi:hypothetical protein